ncbi:MAG TPA: heparan-alpha-glucosaminide N-acetyltransferase domain-containing protein [Methylomirabilota bacterium]|nr:heparan-alpha-glucosaminide N-acetyltransferase domain-containing protein [Methylomirabilota bacterium]
MNSTTPPVPVSGPISATPETRRVVSVDALRGFDMFWIIGGDSLAQALKHMSANGNSVFHSIGGLFGDQLEHVEWAGFRFYDLIFPLFVFIVGVSLVFSLTRLVEREGKATAHKRVFRRFALLFILALIYSGGVSHQWPDIRLLGVLNRIALCYLFASLLFLNFRLRGLMVACVSLLVGYWALMTFGPFPDVRPVNAAGELISPEMTATNTAQLNWASTREVRGVFEPGFNLANYLDAKYLPGKKWDNTWDPEGLLSTIPAIATCLLGVFAGLLLQNRRIEPQRKSLWLAGAGVLLVAAGFMWGLQFPVIKKIWTSSYVLVAGGFSALLLGVFHQIIDVWGRQRWATVFIWIGANAITLYFIENIVNFERLSSRLVGGNVSSFFDQRFAPGTGHLLAACTGLLLSIVLAGFLYRRKIFLRV